MSSRGAGEPARHPVVMTFLVMAIIFFLSWAAEVVKPVVLALLIAFVLAPVVRFLEGKGIPRILGVILAALLSIGILGGTIYVVGRQMVTLAERLPTYEETIQEKIRFLRSSEPDVLARTSEVISRIADSMEPPTPPDVVKVRVVEQPWVPLRLGVAVAPHLDLLASGLVVVILVIFLLANPEDLTSRVIRLVGQDRISLTMQTLGEAGERISRYLATFAAVNAMTGTAVGLGLWAVGVEFAALWGTLSALFRFVPYVGPAIAFICPILFSTASSTGWTEPLLALAVLSAIEVVNDVVVEPLAYGKSGGVSPLGLLVAALFWTWLWGALGLLLSTALTVSLSVIGKYVRSLSFLDTLLGEESGLDDDVKFYQRLLAQDEDGATETLESSLRRHPPLSAFDQLLIPALHRARRDSERGFLDEPDRTYIHRVIGDMLDEVKDTEGADSTQSDPSGTAEPARAIVGVAIHGDADVLALEMLQHGLAAKGLPLAIVDAGDSSLNIAERAVELKPGVVIVSHVPPGAVVQTRYVVRKLRSQLPGVPILVGFWGASPSPAASEKIKRAGATALATTLREAEEWTAGHATGAPEDPALAPDDRNGNIGGAKVKG